MPQSKFVRRVKIIVPVMSLSIMCAFGLIAYTFVSSHQQTCDSRNKTIDALHDVVSIATSPIRGEHITVEQQRRMESLRVSIFARLAQARC